MLKHMPWVYAGIFGLELVGLSILYATRFPAASSPVGTFLGWGALVSMVVMLVYSVARRSKRLRDVARLSYWLHLHIFLGFQGYLFAVFHSLPVVQRGHVGLLNPGLLTMLAATVVFFSGAFGRWLYSRLPRLADGRLDKTQRVFASWLILHRPLAAAMYVLAIMHLLISYMFTPSLAA